MTKYTMIRQLSSKTSAAVWPTLEKAISNEKKAAHRLTDYFLASPLYGSQGQGQAAQLSNRFNTQSLFDTNVTSRTSRFATLLKSRQQHQPRIVEQAAAPRFELHP